MQIGPSAASRRSQFPRSIRNQAFHTHSTRPDKPAMAPGNLSINCNVPYQLRRARATARLARRCSDNQPPPTKSADSECNSRLSQTTGNHQSNRTIQSHTYPTCLVAGAVPCVSPPGEVQPGITPNGNRLHTPIRIFHHEKTKANQKKNGKPECNSDRAQRAGGRSSRGPSRYRLDLPDSA